MVEACLSLPPPISDLSLLGYVWGGGWGQKSETLVFPPKILENLERKLREGDLGVCAYMSFDLVIDVIAMIISQGISLFPNEED